MSLPQTKVQWQKVCTGSNVMGYVPVFSASCPPSLSLSLLRQCTGAVRGFGMLWSHSASTAGASPCDQHGLCDLFAPFVKAVLMQSLHLSQLGLVGTSVLNLSSLLTLSLCSGTSVLSTAFSLKALLSLCSQTATPCLPDVFRLGDTCGTNRASTLCQQPQQLDPLTSAELSRALGGLLRSSYPAKSNVLPDQGVQTNLVAELLKPIT